MCRTPWADQVLELEIRGAAVLNTNSNCILRVLVRHLTRPLQLFARTLNVTEQFLRAHPFDAFAVHEAGQGKQVLAVGVECALSFRTHTKFVICCL